MTQSHSLRTQADETMNVVLGMRANLRNEQFCARHSKAGLLDHYHRRAEIMAAAAETIAKLADAMRDE